MHIESVSANRSQLNVSLHNIITSSTSKNFYSIPRYLMYNLKIFSIALLFNKFTAYRRISQLTKLQCYAMLCYVRAMISFVSVN